MSSWRKAPKRAGLYAVEHPNHATRRLYLEPPAPFEPEDAPGAWFETWPATAREPGQPEERFASVLYAMPAAAESPELLAVSYLRHEGLPVLSVAVLRDREGRDTIHDGQLVERFTTRRNLEGNRTKETATWKLTSHRRTIERDGREIAGVPIYVLEFLERAPVHKGPGPAELAGRERAAGLVDRYAEGLEDLARFERTERQDKRGRLRPRKKLAEQLEKQAREIRTLAAAIRAIEPGWEGSTGDGFHADASRRFIDGDGNQGKPPRGILGRLP